MSYGIQQCLDKAAACERMASQAKDRDAKAILTDLAEQWREIARQKQEIERNRSLP